MVDVNTLVVPSSDNEVISEFEINDRGEIAALELLPTGDVHAVLLIPCDANHPSVEGCDYGLAAATPAAAPGSASGNASKLSMATTALRSHSAMVNRYRRF